jgi:hypothetical protein
LFMSTFTTIPLGGIAYLEGLVCGQRQRWPGGILSANSF